MTGRPRVAVVGHVEWVTHVLGDMPRAGTISYLTDPLDEPAGGGAVAAAQIAKLGARCLFLTAVGDDAHGRRAVAVLESLGIEVRAAVRAHPQTRGLSAVDAAGDRAIAIVGTTIHPLAGDDLGWDDLESCDAVYFTGRDPGTLHLARRARNLVVTVRRHAVIRAAGVAPDVLVGSRRDPDEAIDVGTLGVTPGAVVWTAGVEGGAFQEAGGTPESWEAVPAPGPVVDTYGCGDSFAGGLTAGLGRGLPLAEAVLLGARCGAANAVGRGGLAAQLREDGAAGR